MKIVSLESNQRSDQQKEQEENKDGESFSSWTLAYWEGPGLRVHAQGRADTSRFSK